MPSYVSAEDLRVGLPVEYLGDANPDVVLSEPLRAVGFSLPGEPAGQMHPASDPGYCREESWLGYVPLVHPDAARASPEDAIYLGLGLLTEGEFGRREQALHDSVMSGQSLSGSVPPWRTGD